MNEYNESYEYNDYKCFTGTRIKVTSNIIINPNPNPFFFNAFPSTLLLICYRVTFLE